MKKFASMILAILMVFSLAAAASAAGAYSDMPTGWSQSAMQAAVDNGLMTGNEKGQLLPKGAVTRAQAATMLVNALGGTAKADLSKFSDVKTGDWFYEKMAIAVNMGIFAGTGSKLEPNKDLTREQAAVVISRAMWLMDKSADLSKFTDSANVSSWAKNGVGAMVKAGYMAGNNNMLNPKASITREEFAQILCSVAAKYVSQTGTYNDTVEGNLVVRGKDVTLDGATIKGDLIVGDGAGDSTITVNNTAIGGRVVVRGGGVNSVVFTNTKLGTVVVARPDGAVRLSTDAASTPKEVFAEAGKQQIILNGSLAAVVVETATPVVFNNATVESATVAAQNADVTFASQSTVRAVSMTAAAAGAGISVETSSTVGTVTTAAANSTVAVDKTATVNAVTADGSGTKVTGEGTVRTVTASALATGTTVTTPKTNIVNNSATPIETSSGAVPSGKTGTTNDSGAINNSGSSSGGSVAPITYYALKIDITGNDKTATANSTSTIISTSQFLPEVATLYNDNRGTLKTTFNDPAARAMAEKGIAASDNNSTWTAFLAKYKSNFTITDTLYAKLQNCIVTFADLVSLNEPITMSYTVNSVTYTATVTITAK